MACLQVRCAVEAHSNACLRCCPRASTDCTAPLPPPTQPLCVPGLPGWARCVVFDEADLLLSGGYGAQMRILWDALRGGDRLHAARRVCTQVGGFGAGGCMRRWHEGGGGELDWAGRSRPCCAVKKAGDGGIARCPVAATASRACCWPSPTAPCCRLPSHAPPK